MASTLSARAAPWRGLSARLEPMPPLFAGLACVAVLFSIAASQTLLGAVLLLLLLSRQPIHFPPRLVLPVLAFAGWTLLALIVSSDAVAGLSQVRKLFVFFFPLVVASAYQNRNQIRRTLQGMLLAATVAAVYGLLQFALHYYRLRQQGLPFYENYVVHQITGFMSHWMTFGGQLMLMLFLLVAVLLFGQSAAGRRWAWVAAGLIGAALLGAFTRGIWLGTLAGLVFLFGSYRRRLLWLVPAAVLAVYLISPDWLQRRGDSIFRPAGDSSTLSRLVMARTGFEMIADHPWFGVGPERVQVEFSRYRPQSEALPAAWYGHLHNSFLQIAAERGIPCLIILLWLLFEVLRTNIRRFKDASPDERVLSAAAVAATIGMMVSGLFEYNFGDSEVLMLYLVVVSLPFAWERSDRKRAVTIDAVAAE